MSSSSRSKESNRRSRTRSRAPQRRKHFRSDSSKYNDQESRQSSSGKTRRYHGSSPCPSSHDTRDRGQGSSSYSQSFRETTKHQTQRERDELKPSQLSEFDIKPFKPFFDRMFFRSYDVIVKGSPQHEDFWKFYEKIQSIQRQQKLKTGKSSRFSTKIVDDGPMGSINVGRLRLPDKYSKKLTVPFQLKFAHAEDYIANLNPGRLNCILILKLLICNHFLFIYPKSDYINDIKYFQVLD